MALRSGFPLMSVLAHRWIPLQGCLWQRTLSVWHCLPVVTLRMHLLLPRNWQQTRNCWGCCGSGCETSRLCTSASCCFLASSACSSASFSALMRSRSLLGTMFSSCVNICHAHTHRAIATARVTVTARNSLCTLAFIATYATVDMMMQPTHTSINIQRFHFLLFAIAYRLYGILAVFKMNCRLFITFFRTNNLSTCHQ